MELPDCLWDSPDGEIRVRGTRVSLTDIVHYLRDGLSPEEIDEMLPTLPAGTAREVIAFSRRFPAEVDAIMDAEEAATAKNRAEAAPGPSLSELRRRYEERKKAVAR